MTAIFFKSYANTVGLSHLEKVTGLSGKWLLVKYFRKNLWLGTIQRHCTDFLLSSWIHTEFISLDSENGLISSGEC